MAIGSEVIKSNVHIRSGLSSDIKPTTARDNDEFYEIDTGETYIKHKTSWVKKITPISYALVGSATSGSSTTLGDTTKDFGVNGFQGRSMVITVDNVDYYRNISSSAGSVLSFDTLGDLASASVTMGSGEDAEGRIVINCIGDLLGEVGNDYSVQVIEMEDLDHSGENAVTLDTETKLLTITVYKTALGESRIIGAGDIESLINNALGISDKFEVQANFEAGNIPFTNEPMVFIGGADAVVVADGTPYKIY